MSIWRPLCRCASDRRIRLDVFTSQRQGLLEIVALEQRQPCRQPQRHCGVEPQGPGAHVHAATGFAPIDRLESFERRREQVADLVVMLRDSGDRRHAVNSGKTSQSSKQPLSCKAEFRAQIAVLHPFLCLKIRIANMLHPVLGRLDSFAWVQLHLLVAIARVRIADALEA